MPQKGVYRKGDARNWWVLVADAHPSVLEGGYLSEREVMWKDHRETAAMCAEEFESSNDMIAVAMYPESNKATRRKAWVKIEDYWPYPVNSSLHDLHAAGCNNGSESDSESSSRQ